MVKNVTSLSDLPVVLASASPRRLQLLQEIGINPLIIKPGCDETIHYELTPAQTVMALSLRKALWVEKEAADQLPEDCLIISSDTVVSIDGEILGKPRDEAEAYQMLDKLNGRVNQVFSGVCLKHRKGGRILFFDRSDVHFRTYGRDEIIAYVATGEPMDKAGAYAIQEGFAPYCEKVDGSMKNVIGLPVEKIIRKLSAGL